MQARIRAQRLQQSVDCRLFEHDRKHAILEAIIVEDVAKANGDHAAKSSGRQREHSEFARRADAEVAPADDDLCSGVGRIVEHEIAARRPVPLEAPIVKQRLRKDRSHQEAARRQLIVSMFASSRGTATASKRRKGVMQGSSNDARWRYGRRSRWRRPTQDHECVRLPGPCRPGKLRFNVAAQRWPGEGYRRWRRRTSNSRSRATRTPHRQRRDRAPPLRRRV